jgi:hypothetical protein
MALYRNVSSTSNNRGLGDASDVTSPMTTLPASKSVIHEHRPPLATAPKKRPIVTRLAIARANPVGVAISKRLTDQVTIET